MHLSLHLTGRNWNWVWGWKLARCSVQSTGPDMKALDVQGKEVFLESLYWKKYRAKFCDLIIFKMWFCGLGICFFLAFMKPCVQSPALPLPPPPKKKKMWLN